MTDHATPAWNGAARYLAAGVTAIRVHVDVGQQSGLRAVEAMLEARAGLAGILDVQIVAVISAPLTGRAGAASRALLADALAAGADLAGAGPGFGADTGREVEALAVMAARAGAGLDLHIDEETGLTRGPARRLAAIAAAGFGHPLTVSHVVSLGTTRKERRHTTRALAGAGIGVVIPPWPAQFRPGGADGPGGPPVVRELLEAGVPVVAGGDRPDEASCPMGYTDPLGTAADLVASRLTPAEAMAAISAGGRQIMRLPDVAVVPGSPADLVAIRAPDLWDAVTSSRPGLVTCRRSASRLARPPSGRGLCTARSAGPGRSA